jgi:hypothetical protein
MTLDEYAKQAAAATSRWYGRAARFNAPPQDWVSCADWYKAHWAANPWTSPVKPDPGAPPA